MEEARQELHRIINDREMKDSLLLVFANKQDLDNGKPGSSKPPAPLTRPCSKVNMLIIISPPAAMKPQEVTEALELNKLKDKIWFVVPSCATTGEGLLEGLAWLSNNVKAPAAPAKK